MLWNAYSICMSKKLEQKRFIQQKMILTQKDSGLTLLEVLLSLVIIGIVVPIILSLYIEQFRILRDISAKAEMQFSVLRAGQVLTSAVKEAQKIEWREKTLYITHQQDTRMIVDSFYLADKDKDGILDLYREHLRVANPVASGLTAFSCLEIEEGLWEITLRAGKAGTNVDWERKVGQRL